MILEVGDFFVTSSAAVTFHFRYNLSYINTIIIILIIIIIMFTALFLKAY